MSEGDNTPADLILTVDIARLNQFVENDLLTSVDSKILQENIPSHLRDSQNRWFALSKRARILAVSKEHVPLGSIINIEDLANEKWKGKICTRIGNSKNEIEKKGGD